MHVPLSFIYLLFFIMFIILVHYRLTDGKDAVSGRLWVYVNGFWGTVCSDNFGEEDAKVACRSLGLE